MALNEYMQRTQLLLNDQTFAVYNKDDIKRYVNMARGQIAATTQCIRVLGTIAASNASQVYNFSSIDVSATAGVQGVMNVQQIAYTVGTGKKFVHVRSWPYFLYFYLSQPAPVASAPVAWSEYQQGASGSFYVNLLDAAYTLNCDCTCYPNDLALNSDTDAIPYSWRDAVPLFAAYYAAMTQNDMDRAGKFWDEYQKFIVSARAGATPTVLPGAFFGQPDQFKDNRLGLARGGQ